jgi:uncharacterized protein (TIGR02594 family)
MKLLQIAIQELGVKERKGTKNNPEILNYAKETGFNWVKDDETPWCSIFINWCCLKASLPRTNKANARSWLNLGKPVKNPVPGDIVIFWRENPTSWKGHVGVFMGYSADKSSIFTLGGNQRNTVSIQGYSSDTLLGFRRLSEDILLIPKPELTTGDRGEEVIKLQKILHELNFDCGAIDGVFGAKTTKALVLFQKDSNLKNTGTYNQETSEIFKSIFLNQA